MSKVVDLAQAKKNKMKEEYIKQCIAYYGNVYAIQSDKQTKGGNK